MDEKIAARIAFTATEETVQAAYVTLDIDSGHVDACMESYLSKRVLDLRLLCWPIRNELSGAEIGQLLNRLLPTLQEILDGSSTEWDGTTEIGVFSDEARTAIDELHNRGQL